MMDKYNLKKTNKILLMITCVVAVIISVFFFDVKQDSAQVLMIFAIVVFTYLALDNNNERKKIEEGWRQLEKEGLGEPFELDN